MSKRYVKCNNCGRKIYEGDLFYKQEGLVGIYCSEHCFLLSACINYSTKWLTEEEANLCGDGFEEDTDE